MKLINDNGNINASFALLIGLLGAAMVFVPLYFAWNFYIVAVLFVLGMLLMGFSGFATHSSTLDLRAFTNDPLGWRKAKASYLKKCAEEDSKPL